MKMRGLPPSVAGGPRKLGQLALKGMVINVPADLSRIQLALPRFVDSEGTIPVAIKYKLRHQACYRAAENVRPAKLRDALEYLVSHDTLWRETRVTIRSDWLNGTGRFAAHDSADCFPTKNQLGLEGGVLVQELESASESEDELVDDDRPLPEETMLQDVPSFVTSHIYGLNVAPSEGQTPIGMLQDPIAEERAFPCLFNGLARPDTALSYSQICKFELTNEDRRFAKHPSNNFFKCRKIQTIAVSRAFWLQVRKKKLGGGSFQPKPVIFGIPPSRRRWSPRTWDFATLKLCAAALSITNMVRRKRLE